MTTLLRFLAAAPWLFAGDLCREIGLAVAGSNARSSR